MTNFTTSAEIQNSTDEAIQSAIVTLTNNGFAITHRDADSAELIGPGMNSTRQNPILGASKITLTTHDHSIKAEAELGGVDTMRRFLTWFPLLLGLGLGLFFCFGGGLLFGQQFGIGFGVPWAKGWRWILVSIGGAMLPVSPWLVLSPLISGMIKKRTQNAVEILLHNSTFSKYDA